MFPQFMDAYELMFVSQLTDFCILVGAHQLMDVHQLIDVCQFADVCQIMDVCYLAGVPLLTHECPSAHGYLPTHVYL